MVYSTNSFVIKVMIRRWVFIFIFRDLVRDWLMVSLMWFRRYRVEEQGFAMLKLYFVVFGSRDLS